MTDKAKAAQRAHEHYLEEFLIELFALELLDVSSIEPCHEPEVIAAMRRNHEHKAKAARSRRRSKQMPLPLQSEERRSR